MAIGKLYYSHSTTRGTANFKELPFHSASIDWKRTEASTMSFKSPVKLAEADRIRYKTDTGDFGGQIYKVKKGAGKDYQYEAISYLRLYHDKVTCSYSNLTSSQILKKVLKLSRNDFSTSGIKDTVLVHQNLKWENTSIWDIAQQLCWLEHQGGYEARVKVNADGTMLFNYIDKQQKGYTFSNVLDYEEEHDSTDVITVGNVTYNGQVIATATSNNNAIAKWGYITESEDCGKKTSSTTTATTQATSLKDTAQISKYNIPSKIVNQALSIAKQGNTPYNNLKLLYNWTNKNIKYVGYSNSQRGAVGCLDKRGGNCCDNANLMIGMARAIGIKARYCHAKASGGRGHVYGEYYVNGSWLTVDTGTRNTNKFWGSHWNGFGGTDVRYDVLPF